MPQTAAQKAGGKAEEAPRRNRFQILAQVIGAPDFDIGDRAALRRTNPDLLPGLPVFHRLLARINPSVNEQDAAVWGAILHVVALTAPNGHSLPAGEALCKAGLSESRFARLMAARNDALLDQVTIVARRLSASQMPIDWSHIAKLLLADHHGDREDAQRQRFRIAKDFYHELEKVDP
ncbi:type I-E CRISPR-associated protein Cse2/CasB [Polymorphum gilvum]|uniref:type I-E CRISPR-associated protein Cse2/CasB n=1 Tax=Polymorphum gilvum TaxID=991904 RepID=UPI0013051F47|nr:type I-E CRISPR-associated protein Cse2/CasB [Polymorphum gilvum]